MARESFYNEIAYIGLGGNLGNTRETFIKAIEMIDSGLGAVKNVSLFYRTRPLILPNVTEVQPEYLNAVIAISTCIEPEELVVALLEIEKVLGRDPQSQGRWSSRVIDLDLILYGNRIIDSPVCTVPHPEMYRRDFVLVPLVEMNPDICHPVFKRTVREFLDEYKKLKNEETIIEPLNFCYLMEDKNNLNFG